MKRRYDVIVVGAGPAGLAAAYVLAGKGLKVIVIERGDYPGAKNVMGGVLYRQPTEQVVPEFWKEAPVERYVVQQSMWLMTHDSAFTLGFRSGQFAEEPYNAFTVLRAKFDQWFADKVQDAGALLITETVVEDVIFEGGRVVGVRTGREQGELYADVVIIAEGVNNLTAQKAGLCKDFLPQQVAVAAKEIIQFPEGKVQERFGLEGNEGCTIEMMGMATEGMVGTGFLYTNRDTVSLGVGALVSQMVETKSNPNDLLENLKKHPMIRPLLEGGETKEYLAHLIPEGGYDALPKLYGDGVLVVGDAAMLVNGLHREGSNLAITSGRLAAETVLAAAQAGDFSQRTLRGYQTRLEDSFVLKDLKKYRNTNQFFDNNPQFFTLYPDLLNRAALEFATVDSVPKREKQEKIMRMVKQQRPFWRIAMDLYRGWRTMG